MKTLYMGASPETVGSYVIFSGDPWQSPLPNHPPVPMANRDWTIWYPSF